MSDIQRYGFGDVDAEESCADIYPQSSGMYVRYADHRAKVAALEAENGRLKEALDLISNHGVQYPWAECARISRAARAQQQNPAQDKEQA